jgi:hypothetical protein
MVKERPLIFSASMVLALRANRKTQTRRMRGLATINEAPHEWRYLGQDLFAVADTGETATIRCPYGVVGDRLWVKETRLALTEPLNRQTWAYAADAPEAQSSARRLSSLFTPRIASRDTLEVVAVRAERLQSITETDAEAEGVNPLDGSYRNAYRALWNQLNGVGSWAVNPFVWVVEFRRLTLQTTSAEHPVARSDSPVQSAR